MKLKIIMDKKKVLCVSIFTGILYSILIYLSIEFNIHINTNPPKFTFMWDMIPITVVVVLIGYFFSLSKKLLDILVNLILSSAAVFLTFYFTTFIIYMFIA